MKSLASTLSLVLFLAVTFMFSAASSQATPAPMAAPAPFAGQTVAECLADCQAQHLLDLASCGPECWVCDVWVLWACVAGHYDSDCLEGCYEDADGAYAACKGGCRDIGPQGGQG